MANAPHAACTFYLSGVLVLTAAIHIGATPSALPAAAGPLSRGLSRGEVRPGVPRLDPNDPMANAALLMEVIDVERDPEGSVPCRGPSRFFAVMVGGRPSRVRFPARAVCQLRRLKEISAAQQGEDKRAQQRTEADGLGEVAAFLLGQRPNEGSDVTITRIVVPPFRFTRDTLTFVPADLGPLQPGERLLGTYHTHPGDDLRQGVLSDVDLTYMRTGYVDFHGRVGALSQDKEELDWLFDIVEPRDGEWNVYAHDRKRLDDLLVRCETEAICPLNELRLAGSPYYLQTRYYEDWGKR